jgi:hypothetical protein
LIVRNALFALTFLCLSFAALADVRCHNHLSKEQLEALKQSDGSIEDCVFEVDDSLENPGKSFCECFNSKNILSSKAVPKEHLLGRGHVRLAGVNFKQKWRSIQTTMYDLSLFERSLFLDGTQGFSCNAYQSLSNSLKDCQLSKSSALLESLNENLGSLPGGESIQLDKLSSKEDLISALLGNQKKIVHGLNSNDNPNKAPGKCFSAQDVLGLNMGNAFQISKDVLPLLKDFAATKSNKRNYEDFMSWLNKKFAHEGDKNLSRNNDWIGKSLMMNPLWKKLLNNEETFNETLKLLSKNGGDLRDLTRKSPEFNNLMVKDLQSGCNNQVDKLSSIVKKMACTSEDLASCYSDAPMSVEKRQKECLSYTSFSDFADEGGLSYAEDEKGKWNDLVTTKAYCDTMKRPLNIEDTESGEVALDAKAQLLTLKTFFDSNKKDGDVDQSICASVCENYSATEVYPQGCKKKSAAQIDELIADKKCGEVFSETCAALLAFKSYEEQKVWVAQQRTEFYQKNPNLKLTNAEMSGQSVMMNTFLATKDEGSQLIVASEGVKGSTSSSDSDFSSSSSPRVSTSDKKKNRPIEDSGTKNTAPAPAYIPGAGVTNNNYAGHIDTSSYMGGNSYSSAAPRELARFDGNKPTPKRRRGPYRNEEPSRQRTYPTTPEAPSNLANFGPQTERPSGTNVGPARKPAAATTGAPAAPAAAAPVETQAGQAVNGADKKVAGTGGGAGGPAAASGAGAKANFRTNADGVRVYPIEEEDIANLSVDYLVNKRGVNIQEEFILQVSSYEIPVVPWDKEVDVNPDPKISKMEPVLEATRTPDNDEMVTRLEDSAPLFLAYKKFMYDEYKRSKSFNRMLDGALKSGPH